MVGNFYRRPRVSPLKRKVELGGGAGGGHHNGTGFLVTGAGAVIVI